MRYRREIFAGLLVAILNLLILLSFFIRVEKGSSQSIDDWSLPVNLSESGSSTDPLIIIDSERRYHVVWMDAFDGYKYVQSSDGQAWTQPETVIFPFSTEDSRPVILADPRGYVHAFWITEERVLTYSFALAKNFGIENAWNIPNTLSEAVLNFDVAIDGQGGLHVGYLTNGFSEDDLVDVDPAGIYYRQRQNLNTSWSAAQTMYTSQYFRSLPVQNAHVSVFAALDSTSNDVYLGWDDRSSKRIFFTRSDNGGLNWGAAHQLAGPDLVQGIGMPFNIQISAWEENILVLYQLGLPRERCTQYSQWSSNGGLDWDTPVKIQEEFPLCPEVSEILYQDNANFVAVFDIIDDFTFMAWNGSEWSEPQTQIELSAFQNPQTFDPIIFRCRQVAVSETNYLVVGCDEGGGGDIWFTASSVPSIANWFPSRTRWNSPEIVVKTNADVSTFTTLTGQDDNTHVFWVESLVTEVDETISIQHTQWDGVKWSIPVTVVSGLAEKDIELAAVNDNRGRIILAWVDGDVGQLFFSWVSSDRATIASEWTLPRSLSETFLTISSPEILVDAAGKIYIVFAVPFNEKRGIYSIQSEDRGETWSEPNIIFDAVSENWDLLDHPKISLAGDGRLHLVFTRYSVQGNPIGLLYTQSTDGGFTWSDLAEVTDQPVLWSDVIANGSQVVHRLWQEEMTTLLVNYHQISVDGGLTWDRPVEISFVRGLTAPPYVTMDLEGNLHFIQLTNPDSLALQYMKWHETSWINQESLRFRIDVDKDQPIPTYGGITQVGFLRAFVSVLTSTLSGESEHRILSSRRFLELPVSEQGVPVGVIPNPTQDSAANEEIVFSTPTMESPLAGMLDTPQNVNTNIVGVIFAIIVLMTTLTSGIYLYRHSRDDETLS